MITRRQLLTGTAAAAGAVALNQTRAFAQQAPSPHADHVAGKEKPGDGKAAWMRDPHPEAE